MKNKTKAYASETGTVMGNKVSSGLNLTTQDASLQTSAPPLPPSWSPHPFPLSQEMRECHFASAAM